ncbi:MAG: glycoside hydrolase family 43 protein [Clostridium sp.]|nr:glycoside hydrolase family 43 protein [Clostridium sp.]
MNKTIKLLSLILALVFIASAFTGCKAEKVEAIIKALPGDALSFDDSNGVSVHDPSLFRAEDGTYYVTGSHIAMAKSNDLINWSTVSAGVFDSNKTLVKDGSTLRESYADAFAWCDAAQTQWDRSDEEWETNVWASDIIYNKAMGKYCYYASSSVWGTTASVIWFATSDSPEGTYEFQKCFIYSGFNKQKKLGQIKYPTHYSFTNIGELIENGTFTAEEVEAQRWFDDKGKYDCSYGVAPNCIDPAPFYDKDGNLWLTYGSFSGGIYVMPLDEKTGLPNYDQMKNTDGYDMYFGKQISCTNEATEGTGEGPFITYDKENDYYYFFLTYGGLGALDGYNIREYRSKNPDGPYVDTAGNDATDMINTGTKIIGNYKFSSINNAYLSGGHSSCLVDNDGKIYQAYHTRYNDGEGNFHNVKIHQMLRTSDGWLTMLPLAYNGETAKAVSINDIAGSYEIILFDDETHKAQDWSTIEDTIEPTVNAVIDKDGKFTIEGKSCDFKLIDGTYNFELNFDGVQYNGAFCEGTDDSGKKVMTISALSNTNRTLWAVSK